VTDGPSHVWVDGRLLPADGTHLSVFDRGFQLGDGVFETLRVRGGRPTELEEHLARLRRSADGLGIDLPDALDRWIPAGIAELLTAEALGGPDGDASVRITVSRGVFVGRGLLPPDEHPDPTIAIQAWPVPPTPAAHLEQGLHLVASRVRRDPENPLSALKTISGRPRARVEARSAGADDALFTTDGFPSEATSANVFRPGHGARDTGAGCAIRPGRHAAGSRDGRRSSGCRARRGLRPATADADGRSSRAVAGSSGPRFEAPVGDGRPGTWTIGRCRPRRSSAARTPLGRLDRVTRRAHFGPRPIDEGAPPGRAVAGPPPDVLG
jgi:branched-chain amino acid aminotransferase